MAEETKAPENVKAEAVPEKSTEQVKTYTEQEYNRSCRTAPHRQR